MHSSQNKIFECRRVYIRLVFRKTKIWQIIKICDSNLLYWISHYIYYICKMKIVVKNNKNITRLSFFNKYTNLIFILMAPKKTLFAYLSSIYILNFWCILNLKYSLPSLFFLFCLFFWCCTFSTINTSAFISNSKYSCLLCSTTTPFHLLHFEFD